jgi:hypothetical protein
VALSQAVVSLCVVDVYRFYIDGRELNGLEPYLAYVTSFNELAVVEVAKKLIYLCSKHGPTAVQSAVTN